MKRYIAIFLVLLVFVGTLSVSALASDLDFSPVEYGFVTEYELSYEDTQLHASGVFQKDLPTMNPCCYGSQL